MATTAKHTFIERMIGAAKLDPHIYEEVEVDTTATTQAIAVVIIVAVATGISPAGAGGLFGIVLGVVAGLIGWVAWAWLTYYIGTTLLNTPETHANWGQLARTLGFAQSPGLLRIFGFLPVIGSLILFVAGVWQLVAMVVAVRQALDYTSTLRAVGVVLIGFIPYALLLSIVYALAGAA